MATELDALAALKAALAAVVPPPGNGPLAGIYIWPTEFTLVPEVPTLPMIVLAPVAAGEGFNDSMGYVQRGLELYTWEADVMVYVAEGPLMRMDEAAAAAELKAVGWKGALAAALWPDMSLGYTAVEVGRYIGDSFELFRAATGHLHWGAKLYWGVRARLPIVQGRPVAMQHGVLA